MKKAVLVTFVPMTRVVIESTGDDDKDFDMAVRIARRKMKADLGDYLCGDNAELEDDEECPYEEGEDVDVDDK